MTTIISFDGDGSGLCAHMRHIFSDYKLCERLDLENIIAYPGFKAIFEINAMSNIHDLAPSNSLPLQSIPQEYFNSRNSFDTFCFNNGIKYVLSGAHHFSDPFLKLFKSGIGDLRNQMYMYFSGFRLSEPMQQYIQTLCDKSSHKYNAFHIRTFYDSIEGRKMYEEYKLSISFVILSLAKSFSDRPSYVFCDNPSVGEKYALKIARITKSPASYATNQLLHSGIMYLDPSLVNIHQKLEIEVIHRQNSSQRNIIFNHLKPSLADLYLMSKAKVLITTQSSFGMMPSVIFPWSIECQHMVVPYSNQFACVASQPY